MPARKKNTVNFTQQRVARLPVPKIGREYTYDERVPGLAVCVTSKGIRTWYIVRKVLRRTVRLRLATTEELTVDQARSRASELNGAMARGADPQAAKRAAREEPTLADLWVAWEAEKSSKRSWKEDQRQYDRFLKPWASRRLSSIQPADVQALHRRIGKKNGHYAANRALALVKSLFYAAIDPKSGIGFNGENPARGVRPFAEQSRDRFLSAEELKAFFTALDAEPSETMRDFFLFALLTGARRANCQAARWVDINLDLRLWRIPGAVSKSGVPIVVPVVDAAAELLRRRLEAANGSPWVFPSYGKSGHLVEPKAAWRRILKRAGLDDLRPHDLRRTLGSWMAISGSSMPVIGRTLGHKQVSTTEIYARLSVDPVRDGMTTATESMLASDPKRQRKTTDQTEEFTGAGI